MTFCLYNISGNPSQADLFKLGDREQIGSAAI